MKYGNYRKKICDRLKKQHTPGSDATRIIKHLFSKEEIEEMKAKDYACEDSAGCFYLTYNGYYL